jgi:phenylacetate-coenzyme A ligase PaaK-like adenylate-forming protein
MGLATEARRWLAALPPEVGERVGSIAAWAPRDVLYGSRFRRVRATLAATERRPAQDLRAWQDARVAELVSLAYERVPHYRIAMQARGLRPEHVKGVAELPLLPLLTKDDVRRDPDALLARGVPLARRERVSTGGTSGDPLTLWIDRGRSSTEWAFMTWQWGAAGYTLGARRAVLRGQRVRATSPDRFYEWNPLLDELVLSTFHLSAETLPRYLEWIEQYRVRFLHAYPSSAERFAQLLEEDPSLPRPRFTAVLVGSENLYPAQRETIERVLGCRVLAWYGHSEKCLLGAGCEISNDYHLFPQYGVLEVVDEKGKPVGPGGTGRIVGTGFMNRVMPFLRYATDDVGTLGEGECACGRAYPRLVSIEGRSSIDRLYGEGGRWFSLGAINTHEDVFQRVRRFQFVQEKPGEALVRVEPGEGFTAEDARRLGEEYARRAEGSIRFRIEIVDALPLTARGKFKFVEQKFQPEPEAW